MKLETKIKSFNKALNKHKKITFQAHEDFEVKKTDTFSRISLHFIYDRIDSTLILLRSEKLWDCEMLLRSIFESSFRLLFVLESDDREKLLNEFWNDLAEINDLNWHINSLRVKESANSLDKRISNLILNEEKEKELRNKWPTRKRSTLEQKWSFFEILSKLNDYLNDKDTEIDLMGFMYSYSLSSHFIHADESAYGVIVDRMKRSKAEKDYMHNLHIDRILADLETALSLITIAFNNFFKSKAGLFESYYQERRKLREMISEEV